VALCAFGGQLECFAKPTRDADELMNAFEQAINFGHETRRSGTRLYASVADVARQSAAAGGPAQRAMILFTDALDTTGGKVKDAVEAVTTADVRVYAVKVSQAFQATAARGGVFGGSPNRTMYDYKKFDLDALPAATGGRSFEPGTLDEKSLAQILRDIAAEITSEIVVGYVPEAGSSSRKRKVKVELLDKSLGSIKDGERTLVR
jgi:hypothetical protein